MANYALKPSYYWVKFEEKEWLPIFDTNPVSEVNNLVAYVLLKLWSSSYSNIKTDLR